MEKVWETFGYSSDVSPEKKAQVSEEVSNSAMRPNGWQINSNNQIIVRKFLIRSQIRLIKFSKLDYFVSIFTFQMDF